MSSIEPKPLPYPQTPSSAKKLLKDKGVKQTDVARRFGVTVGIVSGVLNGRICCNYGNSHEIAIFLGIKPDWQDAK